MKTSKHRWLNWSACWPGLMLLACGLSTGCQVEMAGQTLPSPYYLTDDVQYYAPGPEFKLAREAARLKELSEGQDSRQQPFGAADQPIAPGAVEF